MAKLVCFPPQAIYSESGDLVSLSCLLHVNTTPQSQYGRRLVMPLKTGFFLIKGTVVLSRQTLKTSEWAS